MVRALMLRNASRTLGTTSPVFEHRPAGFMRPFARPVWATPCIATARSQLHIQGYEDTPLCARRQGGAKGKGRLVQPMKCFSRLEAIGWGRPACQVCATRAPASWTPWGSSWRLFSSAATRLIRVIRPVSSSPLLLARSGPFAESVTVLEERDSSTFAVWLGRVGRDLSRGCGDGEFTEPSP